MNVTDTTISPSLIPENIPAALTERPQWVCWRYVVRGGKKTKVPYTPGTEDRASTRDLTTWRTFEEALSAYGTGEYDGIGFVFCSADPFAAVDLDGCRDADTGELEAWAQEILHAFTGAYVEASPSGTGVHIVVRGTLRDGVNTRAVEVYGQDRFFTISGVLL